MQLNSRPPRTRTGEAVFWQNKRTLLFLTCRGEESRPSSVTMQRSRIVHTSLTDWGGLHRPRPRVGTALQAQEGERGCRRLFRGWRCTCTVHALCAGTSCPRRSRPAAVGALAMWPVAMCAAARGTGYHGLLAGFSRKDRELVVVHRGDAMNRINKILLKFIL